LWQTKIKIPIFFLGIWCSIYDKILSLEFGILFLINFLCFGVKFHQNFDMEKMRKKNFLAKRALYIYIYIYKKKDPPAFQQKIIELMFVQVG